MRDPQTVARAQRAAVSLERAWERWRVIHGLPGAPVSPVSSYVGYSTEEPWGRPRVVFGVDAQEAELLAAFLDQRASAARPDAPWPEPAWEPPKQQAAPPVSTTVDAPALSGAATAHGGGLDEGGQAEVSAAGPVAGPARAGATLGASTGDVPRQRANDQSSRSGRRGNAPRTASGPAGPSVSAPRSEQAPVSTGRNRDPAGKRTGAGPARHFPAPRVPSAEPGGGQGRPPTDLPHAPAAPPAREAVTSTRPATAVAETSPGAGGPAVPDHDLGNVAAGSSSIAAELAGWASGELPGQASARLAAWASIGGVPAPESKREDSPVVGAAGVTAKP